MVHPAEPEFEQARHELTSSLTAFLKANPEYQKALDIVQIPERVLQFRVVWEDDAGNARVNVGYRVQYNSALGPYKGGLRLHPSVNLSILKFLGFEQTFKNALTGLNMGGGKGGSDFDPKGKSDSEIRRFCYAFMSELQRHIGADTDVPAGDIGTGGREVAYLFGAYKKFRNEFVGVLTGKGMDWGGSYIRPEATGYGLIYYVLHMIKRSCPQYSLSEKTTLVAISGSGNVAQFTALKVIELGATVLSLSDSKGSLIAPPGGYTKELVERIGQLKLKGGSLESLCHEPGYKYHAGKRPWTLLPRVHIALPGATQNEVSGEEAKALVHAGVRIVAEGSNMGCTQAAIEVFEASRRQGGPNPVWYAPGKASNAGGVAVSGLEMAQNSQRLAWAPTEVDQKLNNIMTDCYNICLEAGTKWSGENLTGDVLPSLLSGANVAGFIKVANAMKSHGDWW